METDEKRVQAPARGRGEGGREREVAEPENPHLTADQEDWDFFQKSLAGRGTSLPRGSATPVPRT